MKKAFIAISAFLMLSSGARADEGMWLLPLLQKMNSKAMENIGCRLTPEQIYDNAKVVMSAILKLKPQTLKGTYLKGAAICTTMSPGIKLDIKTFSAE